MNTSKMKAARMIICYGADNKRVALIIGMRRTVKLRKLITNNLVLVATDCRGRNYREYALC